MTGQGPPDCRRPTTPICNKGLTPTPICFPSPAALQAALDPPAGSWLYFVVVEQDGTEAFADTFAQQQANEALGQAARPGLMRARLHGCRSSRRIADDLQRRPALGRPPRWSG